MTILNPAMTTVPHIPRVEEEDHHLHRHLSGARAPEGRKSPRSDQVTQEPIGHRIRYGREIAHIERVFDGGVIERQRRDGTFEKLSAFDMSIICGQMRGGRNVAGGVLPWDTDKAEAIHSSSLEHYATGWPELNVDTERWRVCPVCFSIYNTERARRELANVRTES